VIGCTYEKHLDGLFLVNQRPFVGLGRDSVHGKGGYSPDLNSAQGITKAHETTIGDLLIFES
jgi:hypothetical protein